MLLLGDRRCTFHKCTLFSHFSLFQLAKAGFLDAGSEVQNVTVETQEGLETRKQIKRNCGFVGFCLLGFEAICRDSSAADSGFLRCQLIVRLS